MASQDRGGDLATLAQSLRTFVATRGWEPFHDPKNLAMALAGEAGELVAELQWLTPAESAALDGEHRQRVVDEAADVLIYLLHLADALDVDLVEAAHDKLRANETRFPPEGRFATNEEHP